jgi:hypothetical protein
VFANVWRREELYRGPFVGEAPDVVVQCTPRYGVLFESLRRELRQPELFGEFEELGYTGTHDPDGLVPRRGRSVRGLGRSDAHPIEAIAPTTLYALDVPIPRDVEAPLMEATVDPAYLAAHPGGVPGPDRRRTRGQRGRLAVGEDEEQVADHLRALGYLE